MDGRDHRPAGVRHYGEHGLLKADEQRVLPIRRPRRGWMLHAALDVVRRREAVEAEPVDAYFGDSDESGRERQHSKGIGRATGISKLLPRKSEPKVIYKETRRWALCEICCDSRAEVRHVRVHMRENERRKAGEAGQKKGEEQELRRQGKREEIREEESRVARHRLEEQAKASRMSCDGPKPLQHVPNPHAHQAARCNAQTGLWRRPAKGRERDQRGVRTQYGQSGHHAEPIPLGRALRWLPMM
eukprot:2034050-Pleurochrysis_carterae.AAC.4